MVVGQMDDQARCSAPAMMHQMEVGEGGRHSGEVWRQGLLGSKWWLGGGKVMGRERATSLRYATLGHQDAGAPDPHEATWAVAAAMWLPTFFGLGPVLGRLLVRGASVGKCILRRIFVNAWLVLW